MPPPKEKAGASPYASGAGGVTLERTYGATLLAALLLGDPILGLGDEQRVVRVAFQTTPDTSAVDDFVAYGEAAGGNGHGRRLSVGVRRDPTIAPSDQKFVKLLGDYLRIVVAHAADVDEDRWRLGLAVAGPHTGARETATLADLARAHATNDLFRERVGRELGTTASVRERLRLIDESVVAAATSANLKDVADLKHLTWRALRALRLFETRLEGDDAADRTAAVARLRGIAPHDADSLFRTLSALAGDFAVKAGTIDEAALRRALTGVASVGRSPSYAHGWAALKICEEQLRARTRSELVEGAAVNPVRLSLARTEQVESLSAHLRLAAERGEATVITGEPEVGKSALALSVVDRLRTESSHVIALSLRDLPRTGGELDHLFGAPIAKLLGGAAVAATRVLVLDGAEVVLEGRREILAYVVRAAFQNGFSVAAVTRSDAAVAVNDALADTAGMAAPTHIVVPPLAEAEVDEVARTFPALGRIAKEPRARWMLARPGLVAALLRSSSHITLPSGALCEADVFAAVWRHSVRRNEQHAPGDATPDGREAALLALARRLLQPESSAVPDPTALASLRSDGLLLSLGPNSAWQAGDDFANDLVRDLAIARLLLKSSSENLLAKADAPRWALRGARLACQASLMREVGASRERARAAAQISFDKLAADHGERWSDVPWEALLTLGDATLALAEAHSALTREKGANLARVFRIVHQRFANAYVVDAVLAAPIVEFICDRKDVVYSLPRKIREAADKFIAAWLVGLAIRGKDDAPNLLRARVRDSLLVGPPGHPDGQMVNCYGLLGPDLDARVEAELRDLAARSPHQLHSCLEESFAPLSLAEHRSELLLTLVEAYYIERPDPDQRRWGGMDLEDGIRRHHSGGGLGSPLAAAHYGPFFNLLRARPREALRLINRMLNHAARYRVGRGGPDPADVPEAMLPGLSLDVAGTGVRRYIGDDHVWCWYRGTSVGPYPCISALLAVERLVDQIFATETVSVARISELLLAECQNLAMLGLLVGALIRHLDRVKDELDPWLTEPLIWKLEFARAGLEMQPFRTQGNDPSDVAGRKMRAHSFRDIASCLVVDGLYRGDKARLDVLSGLGDALVGRAAAMLSAQAKSEGEANVDPAADAEGLLTVQGWASALQHAHYHREVAEDGSAVLRYEPPRAVLDGFASKKKDSERGMLAWHLYSLYGAGDPGSWGDSLIGHLAMARDLESSPPNSGPPDPDGASAAVAAAAIYCHGTGRIELPRESRLWAIDTLLRVCGRTQGLTSEIAIFPMGADRAAARGLPLALVMDDVDDERRVGIVAALRAISASSVEEVRRTLAGALASVWAAPCARLGPNTHACVHRELLSIVREGARHCRMGTWDENIGERSVAPLGSAVESELGGLDVKDMLLDRLVAGVVGAASCAISGCCAAEDAIHLRDALLLAHQRARARYAEKNFHIDHEADRAIARVLLECGTPKHLLAYVDSFTSQPLALTALLRDLAVVATANVKHREELRSVWPALMACVLDAIANGRDFRQDEHGGLRALARLIPSPTPTENEQHVALIIERAAEGWPTLDDLGTLIERWLPLAIGSPECVDGLLGLLTIAPVEEQVARGLPWISALLGCHFQAIANRSWLLHDWLNHIRASGLLDANSTSSYQRLVDGLVAAGDSRAVRIQAAIEG